MYLLIFHSSKPMLKQGTALSTFPFTGASVLPITSWGNEPFYALLSEKAHRPDQGTYDDFGGKREQSETHPVITASREAWEESVHLLTTSQKTLKDYIDVKNNHTEAVIASIDKKMVTYITHFAPNILEHLTKHFHQALKQTTNKDLKEKII